MAFTVMELISESDVFLEGIKKLINGGNEFSFILPQCLLCRNFWNFKFSHLQ